MCDFSATRHEGGDVSIDGQVVVQKDIFRYLGSVLQKDGDIDEDVRHRFSASWLNSVKLLASSMIGECHKS